MQLHIQDAVITWNEDKRRHNIREHGIDFADLERLFEGQMLTQEDDRAAYGVQLLNMKRKLGTKPSRSGLKGKTDWAKLRAMKESDIRFTEDAPRTTQKSWANAIAHRGLPVPPRKKQIALRVDEDVLEWFKAQGEGYQTRMNAVLREFRDAHRTQR